MIPDTKQPDIKRPEINVIDIQVSQIVVGQWQLRILWQFINRANKSIYFLIAQPLVTIIEDPLIIDHSSHECPIPIDPNNFPVFEIAEIDSFGKWEHWMTYHLNIPDSIKELNIIGRFGYNYEVPDPEWERTNNWLKVEKWQKIVDSRKSIIRFGD